jgi:hypothetical protein
LYHQFARIGPKITRLLPVDDAAREVKLVQVLDVLGSGGPMKKEEAVAEMEKLGEQINDLYARAWNTALYPTQYGWGPSIASIIAIPVLSTASFGRMVGSAVIEQLPPSVFDTISNVGKPSDPPK